MSPRLGPGVTRVQARVQISVDNVPVAEAVSARAPVPRLLGPAPRTRRLAAQRLLGLLLDVIIRVSDVGRRRRKYLNNDSINSSALNYWTEQIFVHCSALEASSR